MRNFLIFTTVINLIIYAIAFLFVGWWIVPIAIVLHVALAPMNQRLIHKALNTGVLK